MKNKIFFSLTLFLLIMCRTGYSQDKVLMDVTYQFTYVRDLADRDHPYKANMVLSLGKQSNRYCSERTYKSHDPLLIKARQQQQQQAMAQSSSKPAVVVSGEAGLMVGNQGAIIDEEVTKDTTGQWELNAMIGFKFYKVNLSPSPIKWDIKKEQKTIGDYTCQKAVGKCGGRTYTAWFTTELPYQAGPWKLNGLPGLILEAADADNEVSFSFKNIKIVSDPEETTRPYLKLDRAALTTQKDYAKLKAEYETDPEAVMTGMLHGENFFVINVDDPQSNTVKKIKKYNPIEK